MELVSEQKKSTNNVRSIILLLINQSKFMSFITSSKIEMNLITIL